MARCSSRLILIVGHREIVNVIRIEIVVFWLLLLGLVLLLYCSWSHRILWLLLSLAAGAITGFIRPSVSCPRHGAKVMMTLFGLASVVFLFAFIVHGFLFPESAGLTLVMKILMALALLPALCYKAHIDYVAFRWSPGKRDPPSGAAAVSLPIRSETNSTSSAAGFRR